MKKNIFNIIKEWGKYNSEQPSEELKNLFDSLQAVIDKAYMTGYIDGQAGGADK